MSLAIKAQQSAPLGHQIDTQLTQSTQESAQIISVPYCTIGNTTLYHGETTTILQGLPSESVNCVITSPPYWNLRDYDVAGQIGLEPTPEAFIARLVDVFVELHRVLREDGTVWVVIGDTYASGPTKQTGRNDAARRNGWGTFGEGKWQDRHAGGRRSKRSVHAGRCAKNLLFIPHRLMLALQDTGMFIVRSEIIWEKGNAMPESCKDRPTRSHEQIFLLTKSARYYFNPDPLREDCVSGNGKSQGIIKGKRFGGRSQATIPMSGFGRREMYNHPKGRNGRTVWRINTEQFHGDHPAIFPRELVRRCLLAGCPEGGTVLDPFVGSGTVPVIATKHGFQSIGIDINSQYLELAKKRIGAAQTEAPDAAPVPQQGFYEPTETQYQQSVKSRKKLGTLPENKSISN